MKNFTFLALAVLFLFAQSASAQQKQRCITEEKMQELFQRDPQAKLRYEATRRQLDERVRQYLSDPSARLFRTSAIMTVPVVVHIATSNPAQVTDATVQSQIDTLNWYYGNAPSGDSLRVYTPFRTTYGRSQIRFCLAKRAPDGSATTGITRTTTSTTFTSGGAHPSTVVPAWNTQLYMNMWVVSFGNTGILGYSYKPGVWPVGSQNIGSVVDYRAFGAGPSYLFPEYNRGKTGVHEIGHFFNLDHTWGPNNSGNPTCTLSDGCSDTPPTDGPFFGCPDAAAIPVLNACSPAAPGIMWQNHMDYADDACMVLFTAQQTARMEVALTTQTDRNTLLTSNGCVAPCITVNLPFTEGFEGTTFPPAGWTLSNPDGGITWARTTGTAASGTAMAWMNNYSYSSRGQVDELVTPAINVAGSGNGPKVFSFARAYRQYGSAVGDQDTLEILISTDCGATYTSIWKKWGASLSTMPTNPTSQFTPSAASDWVTESIDISAIATNSMKIKFKATNRFGNNLFLDNINIVRVVARDLRMVSINSPGANICATTVTPSVTIMNNGLEAITSFEVGYRIDNGPVVSSAFPLQNLAPGASITVPLPQSGTVGAGTRTITAFTFNPVSASGSGEGSLNNDTLSKTFNRQALANPPLVEGFENAFPSPGWQLINPNNNVTWIKKSPGRNSPTAGFIDNFNNVTNDQIDDIKSPYANVSGADSVVISFDLAHKNYPAAASSDTLTVLVSTDCGNTYTAVYKKWGATLATAGSSTADYTSPAPTDWRNERIAVGGAFVASGSVSVIVRNTNRFGNNIFVDNINLVSAYKRDVRLMSINQPTGIVCNGAFTPTATIRNVGIETITGVKVSYTIDNGAVQTTTLTGINLGRETETIVNLTAANIAAVGQHTIRVYSWEPVTSSGTGDNYTFNDTLTKVFNVAGSTAAPLTENFSSPSFPPTNWSLINPDNGITWSRHPSGNGNAGSAYVNTYNYTVNGQRDDLVSPNITFSGADSVRLSFDVAALTYSYPGTTGIPLDTLEVLVSKDCGNSFTSVYKKWGEDLQTLNDPNSTNLNEFIPGNANQWRNEVVDLTGFGANGPIMLFFRTTNNFENNIFIDNVNLSTRVLPGALKQNGFLVLPSPFQSSFGIWHLQTPSTLKSISVYNSAGQLIWTKQYSGNAQKMEMVEMANQPAGTYIVKLRYDDENRNVSQRVIKL